MARSDPGAGGRPSRCTVADDYILFCGAVVNFDSFQSLSTMGLFQRGAGLRLDFFGGGVVGDGGVDPVLGAKVLGTSL